LVGLVEQPELTSGGSLHDYWWIGDEGWW